MHQLLVGHVDTDDPASGADKLRECIDVPAGPTAEIQYAASLQYRGTDESAPEITGTYLRMDPAK
jgi:hypothetical protein